MKLFNRNRPKPPKPVPPEIRFIPPGTRVEFVDNGNLLEGTIFGGKLQPLYWSYYNVKVGKKVYQTVPAKDIVELAAASPSTQTKKGHHNVGNIIFID